MANEKRLIDASKVVKVIDEMILSNRYSILGVQELVAVRRVFEVCPTVDAVEVVRCKDCKHCKKYRNRLDPMLNHQLCVRMDNYAWGVEEDDFCSCGERRTDNA